MLDAVPQFLEPGALENRLARAHPLPLIGVLDVEASRQSAQHFGDLRALRGESFRWREAVVLERLAQGVLDASLRVDVVRPVQVLPEFLRRGIAEGGGCPIVAGNRNSRKLMHLNDAESNLCFFLYLPLQLLGELLVALPRHDRQRVDVEAAHAFALAVDAQAQASADRLAPFPLGADVAQRTDLEDVGIVPAFTQGRMGEDELERRVEAQELLLVLHDQVVGTFRVVPIGLVVLRRVGPARRLLSIEK